MEAGPSSKQIARELELSEGTARNYLTSAIGKLEARNRSEAASKARSKGWS
ncbi:MAG: response regulator transcription factor [Myxococcales bacterium]|nr:response regulator transcription factor [Myxococcales bacterium]MCB9712932.1 response regulator transcription factor [Myxococcales bacterium]